MVGHWLLGAGKVKESKIVDAVSGSVATVDSVEARNSPSVNTRALIPLISY
jgi:hypothetical protein